MTPDPSIPGERRSQRAALRLANKVGRQAEGFEGAFPNAEGRQSHD
jgi:hypothetical protein